MIFDKKLDLSHWGWVIILECGMEIAGFGIYLIH